MVNNEWSNLYPPEAREKWLHTEDALTIPYKEKPENILSRSAIGYIVIPTHDRANNNDIYVNF